MFTKKNITHLVLFITFFTIALFIMHLLFAPWHQISWERKEKFEKRCKQSSACEHLVDYADIKDFNKCWQSCYNKMENRYQRTGQYN